MPSKTSTTHPRDARTARIARLATCLMPILALLVLLVAAKPSGAVTATPPLPPLLPQAEPSDAEEEDEEWEEEGGEWEEEEELETSPYPPDECPLRSARASAVTKHDRLKLTIGYTTNEPFNAGVEIKRGSTRIDSVQRHFGRNGVLRLSSRQPGNKHNGRLVVRIKPSSGGSGCPSRRLVLFPR